jgi:hypothetical protein
VLPFPHIRRGKIMGNVRSVTIADIKKELLKKSEGREFQTVGKQSIEIDGFGDVLFQESAPLSDEQLMSAQYTGKRIPAKESDFKSLFSPFRDDHSINTPCLGGETLIILAIQQRKSFAVIEELLNYGADPSIPDKSGYSAIYHACETHNSDQEQILQAFNALISTNNANPLKEQRALRSKASKEESLQPKQKEKTESEQKEKNSSQAKQAEPQQNRLGAEDLLTGRVRIDPTKLSSEEKRMLQQRLAVFTGVDTEPKENSKEEKKVEAPPATPSPALSSANQISGPTSFCLRFRCFLEISAMAGGIILVLLAGSFPVALTGVGISVVGLSFFAYDRARENNSEHCEAKRLTV